MQSYGPCVANEIVSSYKAAVDYYVENTNEKHGCCFVPNKGEKARGYGGGLVFHPGVDSPLANEGPWIGVRYHDTEVIKLYENGDVQFDSGGYYTMSSANWMSCVQGYEVRFPQPRRRWVDDQYGGSHPLVEPTTPPTITSKTGEVYIFEDDIRFTRRGRCLTDAERLRDVAARERREKQRGVRRTRSAQSMSFKALRKLRRGLPLGDCERCAELDWDDDSGIRDHIEDHIARRTIPGELVKLIVIDHLALNGLDSRNWRNWLNLRFNTNDNMVMGPVAPAIEPHIRRAVYRYLVPN